MVKTCSPIKVDKIYSNLVCNQKEAIKFGAINIILNIIITYEGIEDINVDVYKRGCSALMGIVAGNGIIEHPDISNLSTI